MSDIILQETSLTNEHGILMKLKSDFPGVDEVLLQDILIGYSL